MSDFVEIEHAVQEETGRKVIHLMANYPFGFGQGDPAPTDAWIDRYWVPTGAQIEITLENGVYHLRGSWPYRGVLDCQPQGWPKWKRFVCWALKGEKVSKCMADAAVYYAQTFARWPERAYVREMPVNKLYLEHDGMILVETNWSPRNCVLVGG